jgi:hypothetical protein
MHIENKKPFVDQSLIFPSNINSFGKMQVFKNLMYALQSC